MEIEAAKSVMESTPLSLAVESELRYNARVKSSHYSTRIEGNRLTLKEAKQVIEHKKKQFHGRERDMKEVRNYWDALLKVEGWATKHMEFSEKLIKSLHSLVEKGKRALPTNYRDGQNVIKDSSTNAVVYIPPEAKDVPKLMSGMVCWVKCAEKEHLPVPIIAALVHYQFVTIHPYYDGNGRTARLLATFILQRDGYGLNGLFSMEEHHARDLENYYKCLAVHKHHNYYEGRANAELTSWVEYFVSLLAKVFTRTKEETGQLAGRGIIVEPLELRKMDRRARAVVSLFVKKDYIATNDVANALGLSVRMSRVLVNGWVKDGWLIIKNTSNKARVYNLSAIYRQFIGNLSEEQNK